jgi:ferric-dicitrate binding protein FerR (iron transport regulator)
MLSDRKKKEFQLLVRKYQEGKASAVEADFVEAYYQYFEDLPGAELPAEWASSDIEREEDDNRLFKAMKARILGSQQTPVLPFYRRPYIRIAAAAAVLFLVAGTWWYTVHRTPVRPADSIAYKNDVSPGGDKATLTLDGGRVIVLDSAAEGTVVRQGNVQVMKLAGGQLAYNAAAGKNGSGELLYNTLSTPVAGQYRLILPDGTQVWLNSASSIRYPTTFSRKTRTVEVDGEAYFEVKEDAVRPFLVKSGKASVQVLGTHFDVMAYKEEGAIKTTLLEGKVKVMAGGKSALLRPGEQAAVGNNNDILVREVDTDKETAWISGFFQFDETDLPTLMRQLKRWYGIDPVYQPMDTVRKFGGRISRKLQLSEVLHILEANNIHFEIDGKKLIVKPFVNP